MAPREQLPGWMYSGDESSIPHTSSTASPSDHPLVHLLPRLKEYLSIVDPERIDRAMELLVNSETEEELFADLQAQYGDIVIPEGSKAEETSLTSTVPVVHSTAPKPTKKSTAPKGTIGKTKRSRPSEENEDDDMSDFIVDDTDEDDEEESDEEESEYTESDSEFEEPEPDEDLRKRRRSPKPPPLPATAPPIPLQTRLPTGPTVICKYGKACYRRNPVHFQEFAHPWLLNPPS